MSEPNTHLSFKVSVHRGGLGDIDGLHAHVVEAEDLGALLGGSRARHRGGGGWIIKGGGMRPAQGGAVVCPSHMRGLHEVTTHLEPHNKALELLLMQWEVPSLYREHAVAAVAEHVFELAVPGHTVGILLLKYLLLGDQVVNQDIGILVNLHQVGRASVT